MAMTRQEVFNKAALHLLKQYERAETVMIGADKPSCLYRKVSEETGKITACAIGCLIPEGMIGMIKEEDMSCGVYSLLHAYPEIKDLFNPTILETNFLERLQNIHDIAEPENWYHELVSFSEHHRLHTKVLYERDTY